MRKILLAVSIFTLLLTFNNCKKSSSPPPEEKINDVNLDKSHLAYVSMIENSYFIYKDSASGAEDSVVVTNSEVTEVSVPAIDGPGLFDDFPAINYELYRLSMKRMNDNSDWLVAQSGAVANQQPTDNYPVVLTSSAQEVVFFKTPSFPSMIVEGVTYNDIVFTEDTIHHTAYYWSKNIGIIKRQIGSGADLKTQTLLRKG